MGQRRQIVRRDGNVFSHFPGAGIPGRAKNPVNAGGLLQFPGERVFPPAAADDKNFHSSGVPRWDITVRIVPAKSGERKPVAAALSASAVAAALSRRALRVQRLQPSSFGYSPLAPRPIDPTDGG